MFVDQSAAKCAAFGMRLLIKSVKSHLDPVTQLYTCEIIARLTRRPTFSNTDAGDTGVTSALVSVGIVEHLVNLAHSPDSHVSYMAVIALANLTHNITAERQILNTSQNVSIQLFIQNLTRIISDAEEMSEFRGC